MKSNIALVGFMGTGKTTIGKQLAEKTQRKFIEMDVLIEEHAGKSIPRIFAEEGEIAFRELELLISKKLSELENSVISTGGGVVLNKLNLDYLSKNSEIVTLIATPKEIIKRIMKDGPELRPVIAKPDPLAEIKKVLEYRLPLYKNASQYIVSTTGKTIESIVREILDLLEGKTTIDPFLKNHPKIDKCQICGADIMDRTEIFSDVCIICKKEAISGQVCKEDHFVCAVCASQSSLETITEKCIASNSNNPLEIMDELIGMTANHTSSVDNNAVVVGSLLMACYNTLKDNEHRNKYGSLTLEKISVAMKKATFLPTNGSSYYGISGPAAAVGIATAAFVDTTPKRTFERNETLLATIDAQISNIEGLDKNQKETQNITEIINEIRNKMKYSISIEWPTQGFPACIKREIYNSIKAGLNYFNSMYEMNFKDSDILCTFSTRIPTCIKEHCRFYPKK